MYIFKPKSLFGDNPVLAQPIGAIELGEDVPTLWTRKAATELVEAAMEENIRTGRTTISDLKTKYEKELEAEYKCSRDTARNARTNVLEKLGHTENSDKLQQTTNSNTH